ncbi:tyrosine-type recombinase/integrase [Streptococcus respiraculi]|uniref:tyrosine-type recombinase/integrase n=1 Tax=Streptococcus respiraculi TaxID=2021971 RepID=UPI000E7096C0|nr:tyrosine-type recombinase/integrase [Streptococcus respiraculi]
MAFYKKLSSGWQYRISYKDANGKYREKSKKGFKTKALAQAAAMEVELFLKKNTFVNKEQTLLEYYRKWAEIYKKPHIAERTWKKYQQTEKHIEHYFGNTLLKDITPTHYQSIANKFTQKYSQETADNFHYHIQSAVKIAVREKIIDTNFCEGAIVKSTINKKAVENKYLEEHEYIKLIQICKDNIQYSTYFTIYLAAITGLRFGELLGLRSDDIDKENQMLHLKQAFDYTDTMDFIPLKSKSSERSVPIDNHTLSMIENYQENHALDKQNRLISKISNSAVNKTIKKIVGRPVTIHSLRHTYASFLIAQGVDLISISQILGHENLNITLKIYAHQLDKLKEKNNDKIRNIFDNFGRISDE